MRVPFGEWLPDQPALDNPGATIAENVIPTAKDYKDIGALSSYTGALTANDVSGYYQATSSTGSLSAWAGTDTTLEQLQSNQTWSDVSKAGGYTTASSWDFAQIGDRIIAVNIANPAQVFDIGSSAIFADLSGSPPNARTVANIRNFIVLGNVFNEPMRLKWSGYNNSEIWTPSRATQSDQRDLDAQDGEIKRIVPGQTGVVFQEKSITVMEYVGPPVIFNLRKLDTGGRGTISQRGVCWYGDQIFYLASDGFYQYPNTPIGAERVNRWFFDNVNLGQLQNVQAAVDPANQLVYWAWPLAGSGVLNQLLIYNWAAQKWSHVDGSGTPPPIALKFLTSTRLTGSLSTSTQQQLLVAFNQSNELCDFTGTALDAILETTEYGSDRRVSVNVRPLVEGAGAVTIADGTRNDEDDSVSFTSAKSPNARGVVNFRDQARFHRERVNITGGFTSASGVDLEPIQGGLR